LPALVFAIVAARPIVVTLFGNEFADAAPALPILMGAFIVVAYQFLATQVILVAGLQRSWVRIAAFGLFVNVALNTALVPAYGFIAAAAVAFTTELVVMLLAVRLVWPVAKLVPTPGRMVPALASAAVMGAALAVLRLVDAPFGVLAVVALTVYPGLLVLLGALRPAEVRALVGGRAAV
jgi:O-antigen/teichoic acid export membrane protein